MKINPMRLERWLLKSSELDLAGGGVVKLKLEDVISQIDFSQILGYERLTQGSETLRSEIAEWFTGVKAKNVLITTGTSEANLILNLHLLSQGDEYLAIFPEYGQTVPITEPMGCKVKRVFLNERQAWRLDLEKVKRTVTKKTRMIFFNNPNNPTGAVLTKDEVRGICEVAEDAGAYVVCDNALRGSELDEKPAATPFQYYERGIVTGSMSKLGMTGLRIGWLIGDEDLVEGCWKIKDYTTLSHSGLGDRLATVAMRKENLTKYITRNLDFSRRNISTMSEWIEQNSDAISCVLPKAGFTSFPKYQSELTSARFCARLLQQQKVLVSPGEYFGIDKHFRINMGCHEQQFKQATSRLTTFLNGLKR
jgi:aspartate/methionine/tyrosine aminotransferase